LLPKQFGGNRKLSIKNPERRCENMEFYTKNMDKIMKYSDEILDLVNTRDEFTTSDLQGIIMALVTRILKEGGELNGKDRA
jgi:hypothetical protein